MRIVLDYRPALRRRTGVGEYVHELARALLAEPDHTQVGERQPDEVVLFTSSWKDRPAAALRQELPAARVVDHRVPVRLLTWAWNRAGWPPIEAFVGRCDVAHAQTPLLIPARRAAQLVTVHDLDFLHHPERAEAEMRRDFPRLVAAHVARADHVIVSSRYNAGEVGRYLRIPSERISVCSPGPPMWTTRVAAARRSGTPIRHILFIGTLEPRKNVGVLIEAYAELVASQPEAPPLVVIGRMSATGREWQRAADAAGLGGRVRFLGYVDEHERAALFAGAQMVVLPSLEEGFGLPVLEAMASGVPVVVSNRGSLPEVAGDAADPVPAQDVSGFAVRMAELLDDTRAQAAAARGLMQASRYSWQACAHATLAAYRAAIMSRKQR